MRRNTPNKIEYWQTLLINQHREDITSAHTGFLKSFPIALDRVIYFTYFCKLDNYFVFLLHNDHQAILKLYSRYQYCCFCFNERCYSQILNATIFFSIHWQGFQYNIVHKMSRVLCLMFTMFFLFTHEIFRKVLCRDSLPLYLYLF